MLARRPSQAVGLPSSTLAHPDLVEFPPAGRRLHIGLLGSSLAPQQNTLLQEYAESMRRSASALGELIPVFVKVPEGILWADEDPWRMPPGVTDNDLEEFYNKLTPSGRSLDGLLVINRDPETDSSRKREVLSSVGGVALHALEWTAVERPETRIALSHSKPHIRMLPPGDVGADIEARVDVVETLIESSGLVMLGGSRDFDEMFRPQE